MVDNAPLRGAVTNTAALGRVSLARTEDRSHMSWFNPNSAARHALWSPLIRNRPRAIDQIPLPIFAMVASARGCGFVVKGPARPLCQIRFQGLSRALNIQTPPHHLTRSPRLWEYGRPSWRYALARYGYSLDLPIAGRFAPISALPTRDAGRPQAALQPCQSRPTSGALPHPCGRNS